MENYEKLQKGQLFHNGRNGRETKAENCTKQEAPPGGYKRLTISALTKYTHTHTHTHHMLSLALSLSLLSLSLSQ